MCLTCVYKLCVPLAVALNMTLLENYGEWLLTARKSSNIDFPFFFNSA